MTPNERALKNIEEIADQFPAVKRRIGASAPVYSNASGPGFGWKQSLGNVQAQPSGWGGFVDKIADIGGAFAGAYADREIAKVQADAAEKRIRREIEQAKIANERALIEAQRARNEAEAARAARELERARAAESMFNGGFFSNPATLLALGVGGVALFMLTR